MAELRGKERNVAYFRASLADLFRARQDAEPTCDACGEALDPKQEDEERFAVAGRGVYFSARGDQVKFEDVPLCPTCGAAIGLSALRQWEIEEEEG